MSKAITPKGLEKLTDEQLLEMFSEGNNKAYVEIVDRYKHKLINFLIQNGCSEDDADDVLQDTMFTLYKYRERTSEIKKLSTWLFTISLNDGIRKSKLSRRFDSLDEEKIDEEYLHKYHPGEYSENPDEFDASGFDTNLLKVALNKLEPHYLEVVELRLRDLEYEEIAEVLKIPVGTVKSRINMAKIKLKEILINLKDP